eukprot:4896805-Prymnesium_polylepis.2
MTVTSHATHGMPGGATNGSISSSRGGCAGRNDRAGKALPVDVVWPATRFEVSVVWPTATAAAWTSRRESMPDAHAGGPASPSRND